MRVEPEVHISDETLYERASSGDRACFEALYERYAGMLYHYFVRMLWKNEELAQDLVQDIFMKMIQNPDIFDTKRKFKPWIFSIAHNMCKNQYRHKEVTNKAATELTQEVNDVHPMAGERRDAQVFKQALNDALDQIDIRKKDTFLLRFKHDLSIREIAEVTSTSEGTVKSRIFYALKELAVILGEFNPNMNHGSTR